MKFSAEVILLLVCSFGYVIANDASNILSIYDADTNVTVDTVAHIPKMYEDWKTVGPVYNAQLAATDYQHTRHHAQLKEDLYMWTNHFYGMEKGIILESGALNGVLFSTSWFYEEFASWSAIHIEADPSNYDHLIQYRPKSLNINSAICEKSKVVHWTNDLEENGQQAVNGVFETMPDDVIDQWHWALKGASLNSNLLLPLPCSTVTSLLDHLGVARIDIWVLDLMGGELAALRGMDFEKIKVSIIVVSSPGTDRKDDDEKLELLKNANYACTKLDNMNHICVAEGFKSSGVPLW